MTKIDPEHLWGRCKKPLHDEGSHRTLVELLARAREAFADQCCTTSSEFHSVLCHHYIREVSSMCEGASWYSAYDEINGAQSFIERIGDAAGAKLQRHSSNLGMQLAYDVDSYLPGFDDELFVRLRDRVAKSTSASNHSHDGQFLFATAYFSPHRGQALHRLAVGK